MGTVWMVIAGAVFVMLFVAEVSSVLIHWRVDKTSPRGILRRLTGPGVRHTVRLAANRFAWNPALPIDRKNRVYGPAAATYWLDQEGLVQLDLVPSQGHRLHLSGPVPQTLPAAPDTPSKAALVAKPLLGALGFVAGYALTAGSLIPHLASGFSLGVAGWFAAWLAFAISSMVTRTRALAAQTTH